MKGFAVYLSLRERSTLDQGSWSCVASSWPPTSPTAPCRTLLYSHRRVAPSSSVVLLINRIDAVVSLEKINPIGRGSGVGIRVYRKDTRPPPSAGMNIASGQLVCVYMRTPCETSRRRDGHLHLWGSTGAAAVAKARAKLGMGNCRVVFCVSSTTVVAIIVTCMLDDDTIDSS